MPLLTRKGQILAKLETTYGTDPTPGAVDAIQVRNLNVDPLQSDIVERDIQRPFFGNFDQLIANPRVGIQFDVEFAGSGTAGTAPRYGPLLRACGMSETIVANTSVTYGVVSGAFSAVTVYYNNDGVLHKAPGCRGTWTLGLTTAQIPYLSFNMMGLYTAPVDAASVTPTFSNQAKPVLAKLGNTINYELNGYAGCLERLNLDLGMSMEYRELIQCTREVRLFDRRVSGTAVIEAPTMAQKDYFTEALNDTAGTLGIQHGTADGNIITIEAAGVNIQNPSYSDSNGTQMLNLPFVAVPTPAGNDELSLIYT